MVGATQVLPRTLPRPAVWRRRRVRRAVTFYLLISPWLLGFVLLSAVPLAGAFLMSFTNYDGLNLDYLQFVGADNYARALADPDAQYALGRTLLLMAVIVPIGLVLQLALALMVNQPIRFSNVFRTIFYLPYVIPVVAAVWVWKIFLDPTGGVLNAIIGTVVPDFNVRWLVQYPTAVLAVLTIWSAAGGGMVVFLAGLQGIPAEFREAAMIDGASRVQVARFITLPLLSPVIFFNLVTGIIVALQVLVQPMLLSPGILGLSPGTVPPRENYFYVVHAYIEIFTKQLFGYGSALLWLLFAVVLGLTLLLFKTSRRWVFYGVEP
jgi:multiple sugar transport system permease protein